MPSEDRVSRFVGDARAVCGSIRKGAGKWIIFDSLRSSALGELLEVVTIGATDPQLRTILADFVESFQEVDLKLGLRNRGMAGRRFSSYVEPLLNAVNEFETALDALDAYRPPSSPAESSDMTRPSATVEPPALGAPGVSSSDRRVERGRTREQGPPRGYARRQYSTKELIRHVPELPRKPARARERLHDWEGVQRLGGNEHGWWVRLDVKKRLRLPD